MEYVRGGNLRQWVEKNKPDTEALLAILSQVADALDYIHAQKYQSDRPLLHRDVKPENVLMDSDPLTGKPVARLSDFGLVLNPHAFRPDTSAEHPRHGVLCLARTGRGIACRNAGRALRPIFAGGDGV